MLLKSISSELLKLRHSCIWIVLIVLPLFSVLIGDGNFYFNQAILQQQWYSLWTQVALFYGEIFFPILIAICASYLCRLENMNHNWNKVISTPLPIRNIFLSKLIVLSILNLFIQGALFTLFFISGKLFGFSTAFPSEVLKWAIMGWLASITIGALQLYISIKIKSFSIPIGIGFCFCFIGIGFYIQKHSMFFPHSLLTIGLSALSQESLNSTNTLLFLLMNALFILVFCIIGIHHLEKSDVA